MSQAFDEVMIVNPYDPRSPWKGEEHMRFYRPAPAFGYYAAPAQAYYYDPSLSGYGCPHPPAAYQGYYPAPTGYGQPVEPVEYYPAPQYSGYGEPLDYGYYEDVPEYPAYYGQAPAEPPQFAQAPQYPEPQEFADYAAEQPDWYGYQAYPDDTYMGPEDESMSGYVRSRSPRYNPGCLLPTNVSGPPEEGPELSGYTAPSTVNANCQQFTPQPSTESSEVFRPLF